MDYRFWFAGIGISSVLVVWGLHRAGRRKANAHLAAVGTLVEAEVLECIVTEGRYTSTEVTYRYAVAGAVEPVTVKRRLDGRVTLRPGALVPVRYLPSHPYVSMLAGYEARHDAS